MLVFINNRSTFITLKQVLTDYTTQELKLKTFTKIQHTINSGFQNPKSVCIIFFLSRSFPSPSFFFSSFYSHTSYLSFHCHSRLHLLPSLESPLTSVQQPIANRTSPGSTSIVLVESFCPSFLPHGKDRRLAVACSSFLRQCMNCSPSSSTMDDLLSPKKTCQPATVLP